VNLEAAFDSLRRFRSEVQCIDMDAGWIRRWIKHHTSYTARLK